MNEKVIITETCAGLRAKGRESLAGVWKTAFLFLLIYVAVLYIPAFVIDFIAGYPKEIYGADGSIMTIETSPYSGLYMFFIQAKCAILIAIFFLCIVRNKQIKCTYLFKNIDYPIKMFGLFCMTVLLIFLWSLLFIVPGIIAGIRYSQAFFIMADDKSKGIMQCIAESKELMQGNKAKFFVMELSFAGWLILSVLPSAIITAILEAYISGIWLNIVFVALLFPVLWVLVYMKSTEANFYEILKKTDITMT